MGSRILKNLSPSEVGNATFKATPSLPVVVLDFGDSTFHLALRNNILGRAENLGAPIPEDSIHFYKCGASSDTVLDVVNGVFEDLKSDTVAVLYIRSLPRDVESWVHAALSRRFYNVICCVARVGEDTGGSTYYHHRINLFPEDSDV